MTESNNNSEVKQHISHHHHMRIDWESFFKSSDDTLAKDVTLVEKASLVGRVGMMMLSCGTGAWRVRESMDTIARVLGITCSADIGLVSIEYTCFASENESYSQALTLPSTGVNMTKLYEMERFVKQFKKGHGHWTLGQIKHRLDEIEHMKTTYPTWIIGLAAGLACAGFIFLLGGGWPEIICTFFGASAGAYARAELAKRKITLVAKIATGVAVACFAYFLIFMILQKAFRLNPDHAYGYIGAMLFVIPGFPFITSGLDMSKLDMRSGLERLAFAILVISIATTVGWGVAMLLQLKPGMMPKLDFSVLSLTLFRAIASFCGVFGFSIMFNSRLSMATMAAVIGAIANTTRLSLVDFALMPPALAAFLGALLAGLLASFIRLRVGFPRISLTVPSIVIMVPGLYMYRAVYHFGITDINVGAYWIIAALMIVLALPMGLLAARIMTDPKWRHSNR